MKRILLLITLSFCTLLLFACQAEEMTVLDNVSFISISDSDGYGGINEVSSKTIDSDVQILQFESILKNAKGRKQKVGVVKEKPDYDIVVHYENDGTHLLHLVLGGIGEKSRVMYVGYEDNGFDISPEDTKVLKDILENQ